MIPQPLDDRIEKLIDDLIEDGGLATAALASILLSAVDAVQGGYHLALCRTIWSVADELSVKVGAESYQVN